MPLLGAILSLLSDIQFFVCFVVSKIFKRVCELSRKKIAA